MFICQVHLLTSAYHAVGNFCGSINKFCGLGSSDDFGDLYFHDVPTLITYIAKIQ